MIKFGDMKHVIDNEHPTVLALRAEIERLRAALHEITQLGDVIADEAASVARRALGEQAKG